MENILTGLGITLALNYVVNTSMVNNLLRKSFVNILFYLVCLGIIITSLLIAWEYNDIGYQILSFIVSAVLLYVGILYPTLKLEKVSSYGW